MAIGGVFGQVDAPMLGERVRTMRHYRHKTLAEVAGLAGISVSYLSLVRETVSDLLRRARRRAGGRNLTGLAFRMGLTHQASSQA